MPSGVAGGGMRRRSVWLAMVALATGLLAAGPPAPEPVSPPIDFVGQWVWTRDDAELFHETAAQRDVRAAVFVATVMAEGDGLRLRRALSPRTAGATAVVVRFDDSVHEVWERRDPDAVAEMVGEVLGALAHEVKATGAPIDEVQLDYDAPVRRLAAWAKVVRRLSQGELADFAVWVTSIPAHMAAADYGELFAGAVEGHILQVFDTGLACRHAAALGREVARHALSYRIGLGAFERGSRTDHGCWFRRWAELAGPRFAGLWVFPAGRPYEELLP